MKAFIEIREVDLGVGWALLRCSFGVYGVFELLEKQFEITGKVAINFRGFICF